MLTPPFRPGVAGRIAFVFGPIAGAMVSVISLRRMAHPAKAKRILLLTLLAAVVVAIVVILTPDYLGRVLGLAMELVFYLVYPVLQEKEFGEWQAAHPEVQPSNGWRALGWGFAGLALLLVIVIAVGFALDALGIPGTS